MYVYTYNVQMKCIIRKKIDCLCPSPISGFMPIDLGVCKMATPVAPVTPSYLPGPLFAALKGP